MPSTGSASLPAASAQRSAVAASASTVSCPCGQTEPNRKQAVTTNRHASMWTATALT